MASKYQEESYKLLYNKFKGEIREKGNSTTIAKKILKVDKQSTRALCNAIIRESSKYKIRCIDVERKGKYSLMAIKGKGKHFWCGQLQIPCQNSCTVGSNRLSK